jgi:hypothetical protein
MLNWKIINYKENYYNLEWSSYEIQLNTNNKLIYEMLIY